MVLNQNQVSSKHLKMRLARRYTSQVFCIWDTSILRCVSWRSQEWQPDCWSQEDWIEGRRVSWWWNMRAWNLQEKWFCASFIDGFPQRFNLLFNRSDFIFKIFWFVETFHLTSLAFSINFSLGSLVSELYWQCLHQSGFSHSLLSTIESFCRGCEPLFSPFGGSRDFCIIQRFFGMIFLGNIEGS